MWGKGVAVLLLLGLTASLRASVALSGSGSDDPARKIRTRERIRLQNQEMEIDRKVARALKFRQTGEYDKAVDLYLEARKDLEQFYAVHKLDRIKKKIVSCTEAVARIYFSWAQKLYFEAEKLAEESKYNEAIDKCRKAIELHPASKEKLEKIITAYELKRDGLAYKNKLKEADIPESDARNIQLLLRQGGQFYKTGQWDKARNKYQEVIILDPYNEEAISQLHKVSLKLMEAGKMRQQLMRKARVAAAQWEQVIPLIRLDSSSSMPAEQGGVAKSGSEAKIRDKLRNIIVDVVNFEEVPVPIAINFLREKSKAGDPEKIGVNFVLRGKINEVFQNSEEKAAGGNETVTAGNDAKESQDSEVRPVILNVTNEPLETVLDYICKFANLRYRVDENAVVIATKDVPLDTVQTRVYPVETTAFKLEEEGRKVQDILSDYGMKFEAGASAVFKDYIGRLFITNTPEQLRIFEQKVLPDLSRESPQVLIQTKFVEIKLNDLEELGFKYSISRSNDNVRYISATDSRLVELAPGESFTSNSIANIYQATAGTNSPESSKQWLSWIGSNASEKVIREGTKNKAAYKYTNSTDSTVYYTKAPLQASATTFSAGGTDLVRSFSAVGTLETGTTDGRVLDFSKFNKNGYAFNAQIYALDQADSADVLSCPRVTTMNDTTATIKLTTEKYYPEEWEEAEYDMMGNNVPVFIGSTPELDEVTELGIMLDVTPTVQNNETIHLRMQPMIRAFTGWDDYSYTVPIQIGDLPVQNVPNTMKMPIFQQRTVDTQVSCSDNGTIVLGGMIQDTLTTLDDKYPILGDLPLIGRFFQSKGRRSTKYNLLIFLSCRLVRPDGSPLREREDRGLPSFTF